MRELNLDDIAGFEKLVCTGMVSKAGWIIDQDAVLQAMDHLGIEWPVYIRYMSAQHRQGSHRNKRKLAHFLTVRQTDPINEASFTLWHELTHCIQTERYIRENPGKTTSDFHDVYLSNGSYGGRYRTNKFEVEANEVADQMRHFSLLAYTT